VNTNTRSEKAFGIDATAAIESKAAAWSDLRVRVLTRDQGQCVECQAAVDSSEAHIHHVIPKAFGGADAVENLVTLCVSCHAGKHLNLQVSLGRRLIELWAWRLARWLDQDLRGLSGGEALGAVMRIFGVERLRPGQLEAILTAMRGESILFVSPTGSGKSFCFQAPTLLSPGTSIVVSPLKALMIDQVGGLHRRRIPASFMNSDLSPDEKRMRYRLFREGSLKFFYCAPERFDPERVRIEEVEAMVRARPNFLVVDEAHCIDKWGDVFRPSYLRLGDVRHRLGDPPVLAFTATASPSTRRRILNALGIPNARVILHDVDRPNITLLRIGLDSDQARFAFIKTYVEALPGGKVLIFAPTIKLGTRIAQGLQEEGLDTAFFHGQLRPKERDYLQGRFEGRLQPELNVMVCTSAFGMGIDIPNIRLVFHWQHPASVEDYLQEFGRAGRDGKPALAVLFRGRKDKALLLWMLDQSLGASALPDKERQEIRAAKAEAIAELNAVSNQRERCVREVILQALGGGATHRSSLGVRLLRFVFERRHSKMQRVSCCDVCAAGNVRNFDGAAWGLQITRGLSQPA
jgi:ATP-dependent DNA helicase RecQ